ncbi:MAG TPA: hypothetical protein VFA07_09830 [Chthonomonadaceae bacterium]|nr:hypothetical protein [Chthonomonadaceae bacterium]
MENLFCEVIGCGAPAAWVLPIPFALLEDHLCEEHYAELQTHMPELAARYEDIEAHSGQEESRLNRKSRKNKRCAGTS